MKNSQITKPKLTRQAEFLISWIRLALTSDISVFPLLSSEHLENKNQSIITEELHTKLLHFYINYRPSFWFELINVLKSNSRHLTHDFFDEFETTENLILKLLQKSPYPYAEWLVVEKGSNPKITYLSQRQGFVVPKIFQTTIEARKRILLLAGGRYFICE